MLKSTRLSDDSEGDTAIRGDTKIWEDTGMGFSVYVQQPVLYVTDVKSSHVKSSQIRNHEVQGRLIAGGPRLRRLRERASGAR